jgi:hypothetical protein
MYQCGQKIGQEHRHRCSIPQGCPFSMTIIALLMRIWIEVSKEAKVEPRTLADDLLFMTQGPNCVQKTIEAMEISRSFFYDMGAKVADKKCFTFATSAKDRHNLDNHNWANKANIPNSSSFRDLGTHLNLTNSVNGVTLTERLRKATQMCRRLKWVKIDKAKKEHIVRANILSAGLYGAEACHANEAALNNLRSAVADTIGTSSDRRSVDLTFSFNKTSKDLDP